MRRRLARHGVNGDGAAGRLGHAGDSAEHHAERPAGGAADVLGQADHADDLHVGGLHSHLGFSPPQCDHEPDRVVHERIAEEHIDLLAPRPREAGGDERRCLLPNIAIPTEPRFRHAWRTDV